MFNKIIMNLIFNKVIMYQVQLYQKIRLSCLCHKISKNLRDQPPGVVFHQLGCYGDILLFCELAINSWESSEQN